MDGNRRDFLKLAGLTAVGAAGATSIKAPNVEASTGGDHAEPSGDGVRLAMVIDLRKFAKDDALIDKCVEACHTTHNVPDFEDDPKNEVKWIWAEDFETAFHSQEFHFIREDLKGKPTLLLCNHCDNPPCTRVCPTQATWKREADGIVMMDWHRCIGCRYCVVACPYGSRSFNWKDPRPAIEEITIDYPTRMKGVVEKCTFCEERIARGLEPACVEVCENEEIVFGDLNDPNSKVRRLLAERMAIRRKAGLGTQPEVYYIIDDPRTLQEVAPAAVVEVAEGGDHA
ncbi:MAG: 4Fe-4S dicluster domain-containing protein [Thermoanaerobaculales bacterium]|jgi:molybdopterin-containing oxidoreductase family iron-sulfur binding subunit|nr:4Fe-4S dicluster domain-containing protein [Thermoanaerobaculales bacterium]